jgi:hypothetical protein
VPARNELQASCGVTEDLPHQPTPSGAMELAVRQGFEPWVQV